MDIPLSTATQIDIHLASQVLICQVVIAKAGKHEPEQNQIDEQLVQMKQENVENSKGEIAEKKADLDISVSRQGISRFDDEIHELDQTIFRSCSIQRVHCLFLR
jgi:hypothetical protein